MERSPMTISGHKKLSEELNHLKSVERKRITDAISEARSHGDLKENAEYHAAREEQGMVEGRIQEIEAKLSTAQVIDVTKMPNNGKVIFGATVTLVNVDTDEEITYQIVGDDEGDLENNKISFRAPIARAIIGKSVDDAITFTKPDGKTQNFEVLSVEYV